MKVTFWLSRNNSNMQEFSVLRVWGEYKILWSNGFQYNERYLTLGVKLRHPPMQSLCPRPPQTHTLLLCSPELPDSWLFSIYSVQLKVCSCPCTSRAVTALAALWWPNISAIFACRMCRIVPVLRRGVFFLIQISIKLKTFLRAPLPSFLRLISGVARDHRSPPALLAWDCDLWVPLSLFQAHWTGIFWPRACSPCFAGWNSFPGTHRQGLSWESSPCSWNPTEMLSLRISQTPTSCWSCGWNPACPKWDASSYFWSY